MTPAKTEKHFPKKYFLALLLGAVVLAFLYVLAGGSGGGDGNAVFEKQAAVTENYVNGIESAQNADDVVKAIERYTAEMKELIPQLQKLEKTVSAGDAPKMSVQTEKEMKRAKDSFEKLPAAMMKIQGYMMNEKVRDAFGKMGEELGALEDSQ